MKRALLFTVSLLIFAAFAVQAGTVSIKDARTVGKNFYYERINQYQDIPYGSISITSELTEMKDGLPVWYVFNFNDDKGFIIVSADDAAWPVIGYSFKGSYTGEDLPCNFAYWMEHYTDQIAAIRAQSMPAEEDAVNEWARLVVSSPSQLEITRGTLDVEPLLGDNFWDQGFPWNVMCPADPAGLSGHVPVGCVATSMTMIMFYWRYPETGQGQHCISPQPSYGPQCANFGATTYEWNGMDNNGKNGSSYRQSDPLAVVSWHGGIAVNMNYAPDGSGAYTSDVPYALETYFLYATSTQYVDKAAYSQTQWKDLIKGSLDQKRPLQYSGHGSSGGHAWVCDGYQVSGDYFHMNWGWAGSYNGYFLLTNLNPGGSLFNSGQAAVINIEPPSASYPPYCSGQTVVDAYDFGSIEDGSGPKADYQNNANCSWLIAPDDSVASITLNFYRFALGSGDYVTVYDGPTTSSTVLGTFTGATLPPSVTTTGPQMLVTLTSDGSGTANGFQADYETSLIDFCQGSTTLTADAADISDGSGRFEYRNSKTCKWYIKPDNAETTTLTFNNISTEEGKDIIAVYDLGGGTLLASYSGEYTTPPPPVTSMSGQILVTFTANNTVRGEGWDASYTITVATPEIQGMQSIKVFPNPASDILNVSFNATEAQSVTLDLLSITGSTLLSKNLGSVQGSHAEQLNLSGLAKGVYILRMTSDQGMKMTKVVVQ
jgi:hypothetical protein